MGRRRKKKKNKKKMIFQELALKYRESPVEPACSYFGVCGGCLFQDIEYSNQLLLKRDYLNLIFEGLLSFDKVSPATPYQYRNRMDFVTAFGKSGLREQGSYREVVDIQKCPIMQERSNSIFLKARSMLEEVEDYNYLSHHGYLRYMILRQGRFTGDTMLNFVVAGRENMLAPIIDVIKDEVDSISILFNDGVADLSFGEVIEVVKSGTIDEVFEETRFHIAPNSFFQSNSEVALEMYRRIRDEAGGKVCDLYSGVGSISLFVADRCESVIGVEAVEESIVTAQENTRINDISNVSFVCNNVRTYLQETDERFDTIVLDPPRSGIHPKALKYLRQSSPEKIIYMSCNPVTFKNDLAELEEYNLQWCEAYDMFPQTPHIEMLAVLRKR